MKSLASRTRTTSNQLLSTPIRLTKEIFRYNIQMILSSSFVSCQSSRGYHYYYEMFSVQFTVLPFLWTSDFIDGNHFSQTCLIFLVISCVKSEFTVCFIGAKSWICFWIWWNIFCFSRVIARIGRQVSVWWRRPSCLIKRLAWVLCTHRKHPSLLPSSFPLSSFLPSSSTIIHSAIIASIFHPSSYHPSCNFLYLYSGRRSVAGHRRTVRQRHRIHQRHQSHACLRQPRPSRCE